MKAEEKNSVDEWIVELRLKQQETTTQLEQIRIDLSDIKESMKKITDQFPVQCAKISEIKEWKEKHESYHEQILLKIIAIVTFITGLISFVLNIVFAQR